MWSLIANALKVGGQLALGYFANDVASAAGKVTGVKTDSTGRYPWWFLVIVLGLVAAVLYYLVDMLVPKRKKK